MLDLIDMKRASWGWVAWLIGSFVATWSCKGDDPAKSPDDMPGHGGDGGGKGDEGGQGGADGGRSHAGDGGVAQRGCVEHGACGLWGPNFIDCPAAEDDLQTVCQFAPLEKYESSCGGIHFEASNGVQTQRWDFDKAGNLIGAYASGDVGDCDYWGEQCEAVGTAEVLCGAGGENSGGAGGEDAGGAASVGGASAHAG